MIPEFLGRIFDHNVVFGALIGLESMYLLTHTHQHGTFRLWLLLLPMLILSSLASLPLGWISASLSCNHLFPFFITIVAAASATIMAEAHKKFNRRTNERESSFLFFASITALCIVAAWHDTNSVSLASSLSSALSTWAGYGIGLAAFTSLGVRIHPFTLASKFGGIALLYLTIAIIGLAMIGIMGMGSR